MHILLISSIKRIRLAVGTSRGSVPLTARVILWQYSYKVGSYDSVDRGNLQRCPCRTTNAPHLAWWALALRIGIWRQGRRPLLSLTRQINGTPGSTGLPFFGTVEQKVLWMRGRQLRRTTALDCPTCGRADEDETSLANRWTCNDRRRRSRKHANFAGNDTQYCALAFRVMLPQRIGQRTRSAKSPPSITRGLAVGRAWPLARRETATVLRGFRACRVSACWGRRRLTKDWRVSASASSMAPSQ